MSVSINIWHYHEFQRLMLPINKTKSFNGKRYYLSEGATNKSTAEKLVNNEKRYYDKLIYRVVPYVYRKKDTSHKLFLIYISPLSKRKKSQSIFSKR